MSTETIYLSVDEVAQRFSVSVSSIWRWKREGSFPLAVRVGPGVTRWRLSDVEAWEAQLTTCFVWRFEAA